MIKMQTILRKKLIKKFINKILKIPSKKIIQIQKVKREKKIVK